MAAAASGAERPLAAAPPAPSEGGEGADSTSLAGGGSASLAHSPLLRAEGERRTTRAAGTPVGGLFVRGSPSPPPKRTRTTGGAGEDDEEGSEWAAQQEAEARREAEQFEADNNEEDEMKWREIQEEREQDAENQRLADLYESVQDQASHFGIDEQPFSQRHKDHKGKGGLLAPSTKKLSKAKASALPVDKRTYKGPQHHDLATPAEGLRRDQEPGGSTPRSAHSGSDEDPKRGDKTRSPRRRPRSPSQEQGRAAKEFEREQSEKEKKKKEDDRWASGVGRNFINDRKTTQQEREEAIEAAQNRLTWSEEQMRRGIKKDVFPGGARPAEISAQEWHDLKKDHRALIVSSTAAEEKQKELENNIVFTVQQVEKHQNEKASCTLVFRGWKSENELQRSSFVEQFIRKCLGPGSETRDIRSINHRHPLSGHMSAATHVQMRNNNSRTRVLKTKHQQQDLLVYDDQTSIKIYGADSIYTMQRKKPMKIALSVLADMGIEPGPLLKGWGSQTPTQSPEGIASPTGEHIVEFCWSPTGLSINTDKRVHGKFEDMYREKWINKYGFEDLDRYAWRTSVYPIEFDTQEWSETMEKAMEKKQNAANKGNGKKGEKGQGKGKSKAQAQGKGKTGKRKGKPNEEPLNFKGGPGDIEYERRGGMEVDEDWQNAKEEEHTEEWPRNDEEEEHEDEPYVQGWEENLQKTSEGWAKPAGRPERYTEVKYDEKIGKKICRFFQKGHCKKGNNCNFAHEDQQVQPEGATEEPKTWEKYGTKSQRSGQKSRNRKSSGSTSTRRWLNHIKSTTRARTTTLQQHTTETTTTRRTRTSTRGT